MADMKFHRSLRTISTIAVQSKEFLGYDKNILCELSVSAVKIVLTSGRLPLEGCPMTDHADAFITAIDLRVRDILDRCTRCAKCVEVCPTATPAGIDTSEPSAIVGDVLDILRGGGDPSNRGARWANACTGSGRCLTACDEGVNPRFMLAATRLRLNERREAGERGGSGRAGFKKCPAR
jgi:ferredoxin